MSSKQKTPKAAQPTELENQLQQENVQLIRQQREQLNEYKAEIEKQNRMKDLLAPIIAKQAGLKFTYNDNDIQSLRDYITEREQKLSTIGADDPSRGQLEGEIEFARKRIENEEGTLVGVEEIAGESDPNAPLRAEIEKRLNERTLAGLKGELPLDPALMSELGRQEATLREGLLKQLGPGWETSTPGIQALAEFQERKAGLISQAQRGDITMGEQLGLARESANSGRIGDFINRAAGVSNFAGSSIGDLFGATNAVGQGYGNVLAGMRQNRQLELNSFYANQNSQGPGGGAIAGSILGNIAGLGAGAFAGGIGSQFAKKLG